MSKKVLYLGSLLASILLASVLIIAFSVGEQPKFIHVAGSYSPSYPPATNIITNGGFETAPIPNTQGNWQVIASDTNHAGVITQSPDAHSGSYSGAFTITANPTSGGFVTLSESTFYWAIGQSYTLSFYYKSSLSSCVASVYAKTQQTNVGSDLAYWVSGNLPAANNWTLATLTLGPIPDGTVDLQVHFGPPEGVTGTFWVDDISTDFSAAPPTATPAPPSSTPTTAPVLPTPTATPPQPTPTSTLTPTQQPTPTATFNPSLTTDPSPTATLNPTNAPSPTTNPTQTTKPTSNPTATTDPPIPELTPTILAAILIMATILALYNRKTKLNLKRLGPVALLIAALILTSLANVAYAQTATPTASGAPVISYSLWFTNGTALPTDGSNCNGYVNGGPFINIGGIHAIASGYGSSADKTASVIVLRNDGNVPINVSLTLKNPAAPSNIEINMYNFAMNNQTYQPYSTNWMGNSNVGKNPLAPGQCMWLAITVSLGQTNVPLTGTPNYSFNYSFDLEVMVAQA